MYPAGNGVACTVPPMSDGAFRYGPGGELRLAPFGSGFELRRQFLVPGQHVEPRDQARMLRERTSRARRLDLGSGQDLEPEVDSS